MLVWHTCRMIKRLFLTCICAVSPLCGEPVELTVDTDKSSVEADVGASPFQSFTADLEAYDSTIVLDDADGHVIEAEFGFQFSDLKTGDSKRDGKMLTWMGDEYPSAKFKVDTITSHDGQTVALGRLMMHGVEREMEVPFTLSIVGKHCLIEGEADINYTDYDLEKIRMLIFSVDPELKVRFHIEGDMLNSKVEAGGSDV